MTGVNDEIQHIGPAAYVEYTKKLFEYFSRVENVELIAVPRVNERNYKSPNLFSRIKRKILMCFWDNCEMQANDVYRIALFRDHPELRVIDYDDFLPRYRGNESCYTADGVHLTKECLHAYGVFVGKALTLAEETAASRSAAGHGPGDGRRPLRPRSRRRPKGPCPSNAPLEGQARINWRSPASCR